MKEEEFRTLGTIIADLIEAEAAGTADEVVDGAKAKVARLTAAFPVYAH
jgi:glycine hydroxymethyltransferase